MGEIRNVYNILKGRDRLEDFIADARIILEWFSGKYCRRVELRISGSG
jgi:hypothetical protein